jgi:SSS family solute:Na+ symporter
MVTAYTILGGMLSVLITDFLQFIVMSAGLLVVTILILLHVGWDQIATAVEQKYGAAAFNPFVSPKLGWSYVVFQLLLNTAATLTWQTVIARVLAAKDARTGQRIFTRTSFFFVCRWMIPGLWGMAALATLTPAAFAALSPEMQKDPSLYAMPLFLSTFVPVGLMGVLVAAMLAADMSTDSSYMLTWGSVIYNDILAPFRRRRSATFDERRGLLWNRLIVAAIGLYLFFFGLVYKIEGNVWDYLTLTGSVYLSSMSVLLVACCYWRRSNDWGAIGAILLGAVVPVTYLTLQKVPATSGFANETIGPYYSGIAAFVAAAAGMIVGSLLKPGGGAPVEEANGVAR